jgi:hypothetical protein
MPHFSMMHVNIILPRGLLPLGIQTRILHIFLMSLMNDKYSSQLFHNLVSVVILDDEYKFSAFQYIIFCTYFLLSLT